MHYFIAEDAVTWKSTLPELTQLRTVKQNLEELQYGDQGLNYYIVSLLVQAVKFIENNLKIKESHLFPQNADSSYHCKMK